MTSPYSPATATALVVGSTDAGYVYSSGPSWDNDVQLTHLRIMEQRAALQAVNLRNGLRALRRELRAATQTPAPPLKILAAGDSITRGEMSADGTGYRGYLTDLLDQAGIDVTVTMCGGQGLTLAQLTPLVGPALIATNPDIVLVAIGTNDVAQPDVGDWQNRYAALIDQILAFSPNVKVACGQIAVSAPWTILPSGEVTLRSQIATVSAARSRTVLTDLNAPTPCSGPIRDPWSWTFDGIHPGDAGYLHMAHIWLTSITPWLPAV